MIFVTVVVTVHQWWCKHNNNSPIE